LASLAWLAGGTAAIAQDDVWFPATDATQETGYLNRIFVDSADG
jgi:hypothetical protein